RNVLFLAADLKRSVKFDRRPVLRRPEETTPQCTDRDPIRQTDSPAKCDVGTTVKAPERTWTCGANILQKAVSDGEVHLPLFEGLSIREIHNIRSEIS